MEYHSFIAGLPEINADDTKSVLTLSALKADIEEGVAEKDCKDLNLFYYAFDNQNLCNMLMNPEAEWQILGTLSKEEIEDFIAYAKDGKIHQDDHLPAYFAEFITAYQADAPIFPDLSWADQLTTLYYLYALESSNDFISNYFEFNLNLQNVLLATAARKHKLDLNKVVIGNTEVAENIKTNSSKDFGIAAMFPYLEETMRIDESNSPLEREQRIDALRWQWIDDNNVFHYFTKERIFGYMLQLEMVERWLKLDVAEGQKAFGDYVKELVSAVKIDIAQ